MAKQKQRSIGEFRDIGQFAVSLYNQDLSDRKKAVAFIHELEGRPFWPGAVVSDDEIEWFSTLQAQFISILDHILDRLAPDHEEMVFINRHIYPELVVVRIAGRWHIDELPINRFWLRPLCQWLVQVANQETSIPKRCYAPGCNRLFIQRGGGSKQKYCSSTCLSREAQRRRRRRLSK